MDAYTFAAMPMSEPSSYIAFALHLGAVHLCVDSLDAPNLPIQSICRVVQLHGPRFRVDPEDLENIQNFNICKGCEARFNLMGYRKIYAQLTVAGSVHPKQLALF